jgi:hypothetical protein
MIKIAIIADPNILLDSRLPAAGRLSREFFYRYLEVIKYNVQKLVALVPLQKRKH